MKKTLFLCLLLLISLNLVKDVKAQDCKPTVSWKTETYYVGETGKLIATVSNGCSSGFDVKTSVDSEKAYGYVKVYQVSSINEVPTPVKHSESVSNTTASFFLEGNDKKEIIYFLQPDEQTLAGTYKLYGNLLVSNKLEDSKEITITVKEPLTISYSLPSSLKIDSPYTAKITIKNNGPELIKRLNLCLSSTADLIISFSKNCKTWASLPTGYQDTFTFQITANREAIPNVYYNKLKVKFDYTTFTGLTVDDTYSHPSITISAATGKPPQLSYKTSKTDKNITFYITNEGEGTAYDCNLKLTTPADCSLNSESMTREVKGIDNNVYEIDCGEQIIQDDFTTTLLTFDPSQITPPCMVSGSILFEDSAKRALKTELTNIALIPIVETTTSSVIGSGADRSKLIIFVVLIIIVVIMALPFIVRIYRKRKAKQYEAYQDIIENKEKTKSEEKKVEEKPKEEKETTTEETTESKEGKNTEIEK
jgi:hypothetical protein